MAELILKIALAPTLVVLATLAARRSGDTVGGIVIAVPVVADPSSSSWASSTAQASSITRHEAPCSGSLRSARSAWRRDDESTSWWDLPARAGATALLVVALTSTASALGPTVTGLLTPFPLATSVVLAFTLSQAGPDPALRALRGYLTGLPGFAAFFVIVTLVT